MMNEQLFIFSTDFHPDQLVNDLTDRYSVRQEVASQAYRVYYDTFDWRLYNQSLVLFHTPTALCLQSLRDNAIVARVAMTAPPTFVSDIPAGCLRETVTAILEMRALLKLFTLSAKCIPMRVLNKDAKTVVRVCYEQDVVADVSEALPFAACFWLKPVRGYDKHAKRLARWLRAKGGGSAQDSRYFRGLAAVNKQPGDYTSKIRIALQPSLRTDVATKMILRDLLQVMKRNEAGIISDIDTEFLHDYRVAIRRTRSALGQLKAVFPADVTARFRKRFAALGALTNRLRDLDVYVLHEEDYKDLLPDALRPAIEPLFGRLRRERAQALRSVVRRLRSKSYAEMLRRWEAFLEQPPVDTPSAMNASRPVLEVARQRIGKRYQRVVKVGRHLLTDADEQGLHRLRIECKKLRYMLEFFANVFADDTVGRLIHQLRALQDNLGRYHDLCVQQAFLRDFVTSPETSNGLGSDTIRAIEHLVERLETEKQRVQQAFPRLFTTCIRQIARQPLPPFLTDDG